MGEVEVMSDIDTVIKIAKHFRQRMQVSYSELDDSRKFIVDIDYLWIKDGIMARGCCGYGHNIESACSDFLSKIRGQMLLYKLSEKEGDRKEVLCVP